MEKIEKEIIDATKEFAKNYKIHYDEMTESMILNAMREYKLRLFDVSVNEVKFCTCGNQSGEGNCEFVDDEKLVYYCCDCGKQLQN